MEQSPYYLVLRRGDADVVIVDDAQVVRDVARLIGQHFGAGPPRASARRSPARPTVIPLQKPEGER